MLDPKTQKLFDKQSADHAKEIQALKKAHEKSLSALAKDHAKVLAEAKKAVVTSAQEAIAKVFESTIAQATPQGAKTLNGLLKLASKEIAQTIK